MAVASLAIATSLFFAAAAHAARDAFERTVVAGWGAADAGGAWDLEGPSSAFAVDGGMGRLLLAGPRSNLSAMLSGAVTDTDLAATVSVDRPLVGGAVWVYLEARRVGLTSYRLTARLAPDGGGVSIGASRVLDGVETGIGPRVVVPGLDARAGFRLRGQATGTNPTVLRVRAWSGTEPTDWAFVVDDDTAELQRPGDSGLRAYLSSRSTIAPVIANVDDFVANEAGPPPPPPSSSDPVLVGAGDIASGNSGDEATATLLDTIPGTVFALGDTAYPNGTAAEFAAYYEPTWGRHRWRTRPVVGNHEYNTGTAAPYFDYFGAAAGDPATGYYSYDVGSWHVVVLNSNCSFVSCAEDSAQVQWLRADLASHPATCTVAMFHHPRFSSGDQHGDTPSVAPFWDALYEYHADLVLSGHQHSYERFAPKDRSGAVDPARGIRQFVVGTGGAGVGTYTTLDPGSEAHDGTTYGVLKLTLHPASYDFEFIPVAGATFRDAGSASCVA